MRAIGIPNFASGVITRRSQAAEIASPEPIAKPSTSAIVGLRTASRRSSTASIRALVDEAVLGGLELRELADVGAGDERACRPRRAGP